jgi:polyisoprenoid-binding protein YceI
MMLLSRTFAAAGALLITVLPAVYAQQAPAHAKPSPAIPPRNVEIHLDPDQTQVRFRVGSLLRDVRGTFQSKGGALAIDPDSTLAQGELLVDAATVHTGSTARDNQVKNEVLESTRYPSIFFHLEHVRGQVPLKDGSSDVIAEGMLNVHGADHPVQLKVHLVRRGSEMTVATSFTVPYVEWGMKNPRGTVLHLSKVAVVDVSAKGTIRTVAAIHSDAQSNDSDEESPGSH